MDEMREWRPIAKNGRDDGLDAVAGALRQVPVRIALSAQKGTRQNWQGNSTTFKAKT
jgi:hypothetical protein